MRSAQARAYLLPALAAALLGLAGCGDEQADIPAGNIDVVENYSDINVEAGASGNITVIATDASDNVTNEQNANSADENNNQGALENQTNTLGNASANLANAVDKADGADDGLTNRVAALETELRSQISPWLLFLAGFVTGATLAAAMSRRWFRRRKQPAVQALAQSDMPETRRLFREMEDRFDELSKLVRDNLAERPQSSAGATTSTSMRPLRQPDTWQGSFDSREDRDRDRDRDKNRGTDRGRGGQGSDLRDYTGTAAVNNFGAPGEDGARARQDPRLVEIARRFSDVAATAPVEVPDYVRTLSAFGELHDANVDRDGNVRLSDFTDGAPPVVLTAIELTAGRYALVPSLYFVNSFRGIFHEALEGEAAVAPAFDVSEDNSRILKCTLAAEVLGAAPHGLMVVHKGKLGGFTAAVG